MSDEGSADIMMRGDGGLPQNRLIRQPTLGDMAQAVRPHKQPTGVRQRLLRDVTWNQINFFHCKTKSRL